MATEREAFIDEIVFDEAKLYPTSGGWGHVILDADKEVQFWPARDETPLAEIQLLRLVESRLSSGKGATETELFSMEYGNADLRLIVTDLRLLLVVTPPRKRPAAGVRDSAINRIDRVIDVADWFTVSPLLALSDLVEGKLQGKFAPAASTAGLTLEELVRHRASLPRCAAMAAPLESIVGVRAVDGRRFGVRSSTLIVYLSAGVRGDSEMHILKMMLKNAKDIDPLWPALTEAAREATLRFFADSETHAGSLAELQQAEFPSPVPRTFVDAFLSPARHLDTSTRDPIYQPHVPTAPSERD